jgi:integrase
VRKKLKGTQTQIKLNLGNFPSITIDQARDLTGHKLFEIAQGLDPRQTQKERTTKARRKQAQEMALGVTLGDIFGKFLQARELKPSTNRDYQSLFRVHLSDLLEQPARDIDRQTVEARYLHLRDNVGRATATKAIRYLSSVMSFAKAEEVHGERLITENPCEVIKDKRYTTTIKPRTNYLTEHQIINILEYHAGCRVGEASQMLPNGFRYVNRDGVTREGLNYILLLMLTGLRKNEACSLAWSNVHQDHMEIPDTKNDQPHFIPRTRTINSILNSQRAVADLMRQSPKWNEDRMGDWVFPAYSASGHMTEPKSQVAKLCAVFHPPLKFCPHDLRRTFATHARSIEGIDYYKLKEAMNHKSKDVTERYVQSMLRSVRPCFEAVESLFRDYVGFEGLGKEEWEQMATDVLEAERSRFPTQTEEVFP